MAKQVGPNYLIGTFGGVTYYFMEGVYYAREKSSLSGKRVKTHPNFKLTMTYAGWFGIASKLAASAYRQMPREFKKHVFYRELTGIAMQCVKEGKAPAEITGKLAGLVELAVERLKAAAERAAKKAAKPKPKAVHPSVLPTQPGLEVTNPLSSLFVDGSGALRALLISGRYAFNEAMAYRRVVADMLLSGDEGVFHVPHMAGAQSSQR